VVNRITSYAAILTSTSAFAFHVPCLSPSSPSIAVALDDKDATNDAVTVPLPFRVADQKFGEILLTHDPAVSLEKLSR
jgi:hypothetical protein